jgi:TPR repeat protein
MLTVFTILRNKKHTQRFTVLLGSMLLLAVSSTLSAEDLSDLRRRAEQGDASAQNSLGYKYHKGKDVSENFIEGAKWYRKSAEQGNAMAQCNLGLLYYDGQGVVQDRREAVRWFTMSAEKGNAGCQCQLGMVYAKGKGVPQDYGRALTWYEKAAERGKDCGQFGLGWMHAKGLGVSQDYSVAVKWYHKAAEQGHAIAQNNLAWCYDQGKGVAQNHSEAAKWYRKAAEQGYKSAQFNLALSYEKGEGVPKDRSEAIKWYQKAAEQGDDKAKEKLRTLVQSQPGEVRDRSRPSQTSGDVCESGGMLLDRLADGIVQDDKDGRIDMGNMKEVTNGQAISLKWRDEMRQKAKVMHNQHEIAKIDPLSDASFQIEQAVRLYIKQKKEKERTRSNDCDQLNNTLAKFKREVERFKELCHPIIIPTEMTYVMKPCIPEPQRQPSRSCEEMLSMVKGHSLGNDMYMMTPPLSRSAVEQKFGRADCTQSSGGFTMNCWTCRRKDGRETYFVTTDNHANVGLSNCNCR